MAKKAQATASKQLSSSARKKRDLDVGLGELPQGQLVGIVADFDHLLGHHVRVEQQLHQFLQTEQHECTAAKLNGTERGNSAIVNEDSTCTLMGSWDSGMAICLGMSAFSSFESTFRGKRQDAYGPACHHGAQAARTVLE